MDKLLALSLGDGVPTDPKKWGPIYWRIIHYIGISITLSGEISFFIKALRNICSHIPCSTCKKHAAMYLEENPPESYIGSTPSKCFEYTVNLHNNANKITGKEAMSYDKALKIW